jgi:hypothetical protein
MKNRIQLIHSSFILAVLMGTVACTNINRMAAKMDMFGTRMDSPAGVLEYEGRLDVAIRVGSMVAINFESGRHFDVSAAPDGLVAGDIVRIYKTKNGLEARLWRANS